MVFFCTWRGIYIELSGAKFYNRFHRGDPEPPNSDWLNFNQVLLKLYDETDLQSFIFQTFYCLQLLIPYTNAYFVILNPDQSIDEIRSRSIAMEPDVFRTYLDQYFGKDYLNLTFNLSQHSMAYRDTDLLNEDVRTKTDLYQGFLKPHHIPYGAGILLRRHGQNIGVLNLFRSESMDNFSDRDLQILKNLKDHLSHITYQLFGPRGRDPQPVTQELLWKAAQQFHLSERERETACFICSGRSNEEIAEQMGISISTVKKHVYHIFEKTNITKRSQLAEVIRKSV